MTNVTPLRTSAQKQADHADYLTFAVGDQSFAVQAVEVRDVLRRQTLTPIPLASRQIAGLMNLRGHIVTAVDLHAVLDRTVAEENAGMSIVVEYHGEPYCLIVDQVGEVMTVDGAAVESNHGSMRPSLAALSRGVVKMR